MLGSGRRAPGGALAHASFPARGGALAHAGFPARGGALAHAGFPVRGGARQRDCQKCDSHE
jgi:hypothetical protein